MYKYEGQGIAVAKKEKLILLNKANNDWWLVRTADGKENFVPANYTKEIEPKVVQVWSAARRGCLVILVCPLFGAVLIVIFFLSLFRKLLQLSTRCSLTQG